MRQMMTVLKTNFASFFKFSKAIHFALNREALSFAVLQDN